MPSLASPASVGALNAALDALPRLQLAHVPTPLVKYPALDARLGCDVWVKRDDMDGGAEAGNKLRKLELLLARALQDGADTVLTCGGIQSNHARATALVCARLGLRCVLFLRVRDLAELLPEGGNVLLDRLAGAEIHRITGDQYQERDALMADAARTIARSGRRPFVVPEGGSNGLGALGYVRAMREVHGQLSIGLAGGQPFEAVVHACGSGGTAAGVALGAAAYGVARRAIAMAVCDDAAYFRRRIDGIMAEARAILPALPSDAPSEVDDHARGPGYAVASAEQRRLIVAVARSTGLVFDPVYTGKALHGLALARARSDVPLGARVLLIHTGGLPGLLAQAEDLLSDL
jgi:D-cysteine desulfhydrase